MFQPRSIMMSISLIVIVLTLAACSGSNEPLPSPQPSMPVGEPAPVHLQQKMNNHLKQMEQKKQMKRSVHRPQVLKC